MFHYFKLFVNKIAGYKSLAHLLFEKKITICNYMNWLWHHDDRPTDQPIDQPTDRQRLQVKDVDFRGAINWLLHRHKYIDTSITLLYFMLVGNSKIVPIDIRVCV